MSMTTHFIERYFERILMCNNYLAPDEAVSAIYADIMHRMSGYQNNALSIFLSGHVKKVFLPIGIGHQMLIKNNMAVTIY